MTDIIEVGTFKFQTHILQQMLPDIETTLFFAQLFRLGAQDTGRLIHALFGSELIEALVAEGGYHSDLLQDFLVDIVPDVVRQGDIVFGDRQPKGEILPHMWEQANITIAKSIQDVADQLGTVLGGMDGRKSEMLFSTLAQLNTRRNSIGEFKAQVQRKVNQASNLVVLDVSGSVTQETVEKIAGEAVALAWRADAHLAIVSNTATCWAPGGATVESVLDSAEYGGTHYEELFPLFDTQNWSTVVTIADYDGSRASARALAKARGRVEQVLDISLVSRPTYLGEAIAQLSKHPARVLLMADEDASLCY